jgi:hypothetical protein
MRNEPNSRRGRVGQGRRDAGQGENVQNEANFVLPGTCGSESIGGSRARTPNLRRAELCETNPISLGPQEGQSLGAESAKRTQFPTRPGGTGPQGRGTRGKYAKRTQFPAGPGGPEPVGRGTRGKCAKRTQFAGGRDIPLLQYAIIPPFQSNADGAKRTQFGPRRWRAKCFMAKSLGTIRHKTGTEKRSQFVVFRQTPGNAHPPPCARPHPTSAFSSYCSLPVRPVN